MEASFQRCRWRKGVEHAEGDDQQQLHPAYKLFAFDLLGGDAFAYPCGKVRLQSLTKDKYRKLFPHGGFPIHWQFPQFYNNSGRVSEF